jgi:hypothetical protein
MLRDKAPDVPVTVTTLVFGEFGLCDENPPPPPPPQAIMPATSARMMNRSNRRRELRVPSTTTPKGKPNQSARYVGRDVTRAAVEREIVRVTELPVVPGVIVWDVNEQLRPAVSPPHPSVTGASKLPNCGDRSMV